MKSAIVSRFGGPEVLELRDVPVPEPGEGEVRIKVKACGINYADIMQREGLYPNGPKAPFGAGFEVAGEIDALGPRAAGWAEGDAVMTLCSDGYSEYVVVAADRLLAKPNTLNFHQAAAVPCQYLTAYHALITLGRLQAGQTVLIQAAAGGLGTMLVQIAHDLGATIFGTASTAEKCELIRRLGCDHAINYTETKFRKVVRAHTNNQGCDLVIESVGGEVFDHSLASLKPRGMLITLGIASKEPPTVHAAVLLAKNWTVAGFHLMEYLKDQKATRDAVQYLHERVASGKLEFIAKHEFPLEKAAEAQQFISDRKSTGKVVLIP
jgi:NADPH:quinone reductase